MILREIEAQEYLRLGRTKTREVAKAAGAVVHFGRAVRYNSDALDRYIAGLTEGGNDDRGGTDRIPAAV